MLWIVSLLPLLPQRNSGAASARSVCKYAGINPNRRCSSSDSERSECALGLHWDMIYLGHIEAGALELVQDFFQHGVPNNDLRHRLQAVHPHRVIELAAAGQTTDETRTAISNSESLNSGSGADTQPFTERRERHRMVSSQNYQPLRLSALL